MLLCCLLFVIGLVGLAFSVYVSFVFALLMIILVGAASSFGESILLTYQRNFPAEVVGGWSSGTGMAGVGGSLLTILFSAVLKFSNQEIFICLLPSVIIYMMAYGQMLQPDPNIQATQPSAPPSPPTAIEQLNSDLKVEDSVPLLSPVSETKVQRYWRCTKLVAWQVELFCAILVLFIERLVGYQLASGVFF